LGSDGKRLAIIAHSGVGKTSLLEHLRQDPRLTGKLVVDLDSVMPEWFDRAKADTLDRESSADYWLWAKMSATQAAIRQKADIVAGLFAEGKLRDLLEDKGYSLVALSVPESTHRERLDRQLEKRGRKGIEDVQKSLSGQKRLEGLGYELIDANRPVAQVADDVVKIVVA
jgi:energy-coupling factor transporter ATP-binding protein EcfA2